MTFSLGPVAAYRVRLLLVLMLIFSAGSRTTTAQDRLPPSVVTASFSNPFAPLPEGASSSSALPAPGADGPEDVSWKNLPIHILRDQKYVWLFPVRVAQGRHILPTATIVGITGVFIATDPHDMPYFAKTTDFNRYTETFNGAFTGSFMAAVPVSLYLYGLVRHDNYSEQTALLAGEAYLDSAIPHVLIKVVSRRYRPSAIPPNGSFSDTFFRSSTSVFGKGSSFPSGHAAGAFSIATVIARRYRQYRWVPWASYAIAGIFAFSRVPARAHFPSDVFLGAALGYAITRYDVLRYEP
jgi:membrane-associated phospholipid phosphatase